MEPSSGAELFSRTEVPVSQGLQHVLLQYRERQHNRQSVPVLAMQPDLGIYYLSWGLGRHWYSDLAMHLPTKNKN
jgi:hypothetical protein